MVGAMVLPCTNHHEGLLLCECLMQLVRDSVQGIKVVHDLLLGCHCTCELLFNPFQLTCAFSFCLLSEGKSDTLRAS